MKLFFIPVIAFACHVVDGPNITGRDLAAADPAYSTLDPDAVIAASPLPGVRRTLHNLCFERATRTLQPEEVLEAARNALSLQSPTVELLDFTRTPVPIGTLEFSQSGLSPTGIWRGRVRFDGNRTFPIWAKVRITTEQTWIEAIQPLAPGQPIEAARLLLRTGPRSPFGPAPIGAVETVVGRAPVRSIKPGEPIFAAMLTTPHDVERGQSVRVEASSGEAAIVFDAVAQSSGRAGESVLVRNPENGRYFSAHVEGKGKVSVTK